MKEIIFGFLPGSIFIFRYSPRLSLGSLGGLFLMEVMPFLIAAIIESINPFQVLVGFYLLYGVYELGYLDNDVKASGENVGATIRDQFSKFNHKIFLLIRIPLMVGVFSLIFFEYSIVSYFSIVILLAILPIFFIHNRLRNRFYRVCTFLALNNIKIIARIVILGPGLAYYIISSMPHLFIKTLHYMNAKNLIVLDDCYLKGITFPVYLGFFLSFAFIDPWLIAVASPYFINHTKSIIIKFVCKKFTLA
jgi:hypothetical protein